MLVDKGCDHCGRTDVKLNEGCNPDGVEMWVCTPCWEYQEQSMNEMVFVLALILILLTLIAQAL